LGKPAKKNLDIYRGDDFDFFFRVRSQSWDAVTSTWVAGDYVDMTNWQVQAQIRKELDPDSELLATFTGMVTDQVTIPGGVIVSLTAVQTKDLVPSYWDLQLVSPVGKIRTYIKGKVKPDGEATA
jgi:hypothetical protein